MDFKNLGVMSMVIVAGVAALTIQGAGTPIALARDFGFSTDGPPDPAIGIPCPPSNIAVNTTLSGALTYLSGPAPAFATYTFNGSAKFSYDCDPGNINACLFCVKTRVLKDIPNGNPPTVLVARTYMSESGSPCGSTGNILSLTNTTTMLDPLSTYTIDMMAYLPGQNGCQDDAFASGVSTAFTFDTGPN